MNIHANTLQGLHDLLIDELKEIYWSQITFTKLIPEIIKRATSPELVTILTTHLLITHQQVMRLQNVFLSINLKCEVKKCRMVKQLSKEANQQIKNTEKGDVCDGAIIFTSQKAVYYKVATYSILCTYAKILQMGEATDLLEQTLFEEKEAVEKLFEIARHYIKAVKN